MHSKLSGSVQDVLHLYHITSVSVGADRSAPVHESVALTLTPGEGARKAGMGAVKSRTRSPLEQLNL